MSKELLSWTFFPNGHDKAKRWADDVISLQVSLLSYRPLHTCVCCAYLLASTHVTYSFLDIFFPMVMIKPRDWQVMSHPFRSRWAIDLCTHVSAVLVYFTVSKSVYSLCVFISTLCFSGVEGYLLCLYLSMTLHVFFFYTCFGSLSYFVFMIQCFDVLWCKEV